MGVLFCRLDKALIRPGRVDVRSTIDYCTPYQLELMFQRFYPDEPQSTANEFAQKVGAFAKNISAAQVQGYFMFYKDNAQDALNNITDIVKL